MKFIFVNRFFFPDRSATSQLLSDLAFRLTAAGEEVMVVTSRTQLDAPAAPLPGRESIQGVEVIRVHSTRFGRRGLFARLIDYLSFHVGARRALREHCRREDVIVAKSDPPLLSVLAARVADETGARFVNWTHDVFPEVAAALRVPLMRGMLVSVLRGWRDASLRGAMVNVVVSRRMKELLAGRVGPDVRFEFVPNWSVTEPEAPSAAREAPDRAFRVGYCGNLGRAHEFETMLDAASRLVGDERVRIEFHGVGARRAWLEAEVSRRGLANVGFGEPVSIEHLDAHLASFDAHLISLRPELEGLVFPSKLYGVIAAARPALFVGAPDGEIADLIEEHGFGLAVSSGDPEALASGIRSLADDPTLARRLGEAGRALYESRFRRELAHRRWLDLLGCAHRSIEAPS